MICKTYPYNERTKQTKTFSSRKLSTVLTSEVQAELGGRT